jgi:hypothetical protein
MAEVRNDYLFCEVRRHTSGEGRDMRGMLWFARVIDDKTNRVLRECRHRHRTSGIAARCSERMAGQINRERGTRLVRHTDRNRNPSGGQLRSRQAFAAGIRGAAIIRLRVNELMREHDGHTVLLIDPSGVEDATFGLRCADCELGAVVQILVTGLEDSE